MSGQDEPFEFVNAVILSKTPRTSMSGLREKLQAVNTYTIDDSSNLYKSTTIDQNLKFKTLKEIHEKQMKLRLDPLTLSEV